MHFVGHMRRVGALRAFTLAALIGLLGGGLLAAATRPVQAQLFPGSAPAIAPVGGGTSEFRGLWVDAYHDGVKTPEQVDRLVADARRANVNALIVQVRRRGDAYYARSTEPRTEDSSLAAGFDALDYLIDRAHNGSPRLEVHAWIATTPIWGDRDRPPLDLGHVFNQHGPHKEGRDAWISRRDDGETWATGYFLDPGHPDAARYTAEVALNLVREYDVDGLHLDYIRYHEGGDGHAWGYNETSVARFNARHGREGQPALSDPAWAQWRRDQLTALVRRIYLGSTAIKPRVKVSAAVIPWGDGPRTTAEWSRSSAYTRVYQDWRAWLEEGILDLAIPMNYFRESQPAQAGWLDRWVAFQRDHAYGRQVAPGLGLYMNSPAENLAQLSRVSAPGPNGARVAGVALYSYAVPKSASEAGSERSQKDAGIDFWRAGPPRSAERRQPSLRRAGRGSAHGLEERAEHRRASGTHARIGWRGRRGQWPDECCRPGRRRRRLRDRRAPARALHRQRAASEPGRAAHGCARRGAGRGGRAGAAVREYDVRPDSPHSRAQLSDP